MNNSDMPAMPVRGFKIDDSALHGQLHHGLTKRELFAAMAMAAAISNQRVQMDKPVEGIAIFAVRHADALLKALEKE